MLKFTWPRLWHKSCVAKFLVIFNVVTVLVSKLTSVAVPLLLKIVVDAIVCVEVEDLDDCPEKAECELVGQCATE